MNREFSLHKFRTKRYDKVTITLHFYGILLGHKMWIASQVFAYTRWCLVFNAKLCFTRWAVHKGDFMCLLKANKLCYYLGTSYDSLYEWSAYCMLVYMSEKKEKKITRLFLNFCDQNWYETHIIMIIIICFNWLCFCKIMFSRNLESSFCSTIDAQLKFSIPLKLHLQLSSYIYTC